MVSFFFVEFFATFAQPLRAVAVALHAIYRFYVVALGAAAVVVIDVRADGVKRIHDSHYSSPC